MRMDLDRTIHACAVPRLGWVMFCDNQCIECHTSASNDFAGVRKLAPEMSEEMTEQTGSVSFLTNSTAVEIPR